MVAIVPFVSPYWDHKFPDEIPVNMTSALCIRRRSFLVRVSPSASSSLTFSPPPTTTTTVPVCCMRGIRTGILLLQALLDSFGQPNHWLDIDEEHPQRQPWHLVHRFLCARTGDGVDQAARQWSNLLSTIAALRIKTITMRHWISFSKIIYWKRSSFMATSWMRTTTLGEIVLHVYRYRYRSFFNSGRRSLLRSCSWVRKKTERNGQG